MVIKHNFASESMLCWAAMVDFWQARLPQWQPHHRYAAATPTTFYLTKFRQDCGFAVNGTPVLAVYLINKILRYWTAKPSKI